MIEPGYARAMAAYNAEMNRRTYRAAYEVPDARRRQDDGAFWGSIHGTLSHLYWGDVIWMWRFGVGSEPTVGVADSHRMVEDFDELWAMRQALDADIAGWADGLAPEAVAGDLTWWSGVKQREMSRSRAICIMQLFNHQTHHRGQVHVLLSRRGKKVGDTDLPFVI